MLDNLAELGINLDDVSEQLQVDGIKAFTQAYDELIACLNRALQTTAIAND